jgi:hypothetical protein
MRARLFVMMIASSLLLPIGAAAQTSAVRDGTTAPVQKQYTAGQTTTTTTTSVNTQNAENEWLASGFAGSNFANNAQPASTAFGGSIGYLWNSRWGAEFDAGFTPNFDLQSNFFGLGITPTVNSYMVNAVAVRPFGLDKKWQPFIAGGVGAISLRSGLSSDTVSTYGNPDSTRFGGDIGGGLMGFLGNWGFKADLQYFRAAGSYQTSAGQYSTVTVTGTTTGTTPSNSTTPGTGTTPTPAPTPAPVGPYVANDTGGMTSSPSSLADTVLSGLHFWRANIGVALRW